MEKIIIIVRGVSGSGKSNLAEHLGKAICCADDYFMRNNKYLWTFDHLGIAHDWCKRKCVRFMKFGISPIIISNTSTTEKEIKPYMDLAIDYNYKVFSIIVENRHGGTNVHNVPDVTLQKMRNKFEIKL